MLMVYLFLPATGVQCTVDVLCNGLYSFNALFLLVWRVNEISANVKGAGAPFQIKKTNFSLLSLVLLVERIGCLNT